MMSTRYIGLVLIAIAIMMTLVRGKKDDPPFGVCKSRRERPHVRPLPCDDCIDNLAVHKHAMKKNKLKKERLTNEKMYKTRSALVVTKKNGKNHGMLAVGLVVALVGGSVAMTPSNLAYYLGYMMGTILAVILQQKVQTFSIQSIAEMATKEWMVISLIPLLASSLVSSKSQATYLSFLAVVALLLSQRYQHAFKMNDTDEHE